LKAPNITVTRSRDLENLSDIGTGFFLDQMPEGYVFLLDDCISYPHDYVARMVATIEKYRRRALVTVKGSIFADPLESYSERSAMWPLEAALPSDRIVTLPGSGSLAFHTDALRVPSADFSSPQPVGLRLAILAKARQIPIVAVSRARQWLRSTNEEKPNEPLSEHMTRLTDEANRAGPWDYHSMRRLLLPVFQEIFPDLTRTRAAALGLDGDFLFPENGTLPKAWGRTETYFTSKLARIERSDLPRARAELEAARAEHGRRQRSPAFVVGSLIVQPAAFASRLLGPIRRRTRKRVV
jgi:hypothetical protein